MRNIFNQKIVTYEIHYRYKKEEESWSFGGDILMDLSGFCACFESTWFVGYELNVPLKEFVSMIQAEVDSSIKDIFFFKNMKRVICLFLKLPYNLRVGRVIYRKEIIYVENI